VTEAVVSEAMTLGLAEDRAEARRMVMTIAERSAVVTDKRGNRRCGSFYLTVSGGVVTGLVLRAGVVHWCDACLDAGVVMVPDGSIACPECSARSGRR
jgi:hypothetical protein